MSEATDNGADVQAETELWFTSSSHYILFRLECLSSPPCPEVHFSGWFLEDISPSPRLQLYCVNAGLQPIV